MKKASFLLLLALFAGCISSKGQAFSSMGEDNRILNPDQYRYDSQFLRKRELKVPGKLAGDAWLQLAGNALRRNSSDEDFEEIYSMQSSWKDTISVPFKVEGVEHE